MNAEKADPKRYCNLQAMNSVVMTVDVEDYFMSPESIHFEDWPSFPSYIHTGMKRCLLLFEEFEAKATFFFVGWLAERYPEIVEWTVNHGHEIGTHTYNHTYVSELDEKQFADSLHKSMKVIQQAAPGVKIIGHRAPAFSLERSKPWQFQVLKDHGILYDSSINPHSTYLYGEKHAPRFPYWHEGIVEIPPASIKVMGKQMPVGGGGTLRILPQFYLRWARHKYLNEGYLPVIYLHPWEFVPEHPKLDLPFKLKLIHWWGIHSVERKLCSILDRFGSITMGEYYNLLIETPDLIQNI